MELLAPAGSVDHFLAAVNAGADAVYVGAPQLNARNPAKEFRYDEIRAMAGFCRDHNTSLYVALNSLIRESDISQLITSLAELESISPDALIVQDLGVIDLVRRYFPGLKLHASTLMCSHNSGGVEALARLGCSRVVLARELSLSEIEEIVVKSPAEVEIFIHGAMCFSYSGTCLFSSYHGGKSSMRGNCVQPCRRKYEISSSQVRKGGSKKKSGYFFSMNDLEGIELIEDFSRLSISAIKIEGRLRPVNYVENVVRAYRVVMDADKDGYEESLKEARQLIKSALGRKSSPGFFLSTRPKEVISAQHSGNLGTYLGRLERIQKRGKYFYGTIASGESCQPGERFRLHFETNGERVAFTAKEITPVDPNRYQFQLPSNLRSKALNGPVSLYRIDIKSRGDDLGAFSAGLPEIHLTQAESKRIRKKRRELLNLLESSPKTAKTTGGRGSGKGFKKSLMEVWLRLDSVKPVFQKLPFSVDRFVFNMDKKTLAMAGQLKHYFGREKNRVIWALPSVTHERLFWSLKKDIAVLLKSGFRQFQIASLGQLFLFEDESATLYGDYTLNLLNSRALRTASALGLTGFQLSIEADKASLSGVTRKWRDSSTEKSEYGRGSARKKSYISQLGLTVYGAPPLFISRAEPDQSIYGQTISSPRGEQFITQKKSGLSYTRPTKPFSLLPFKKELEQLGLDYMVIDLSGMRSGRKEMEGVAGRLMGKGTHPRLPSFNYRGVLE